MASSLLLHSSLLKKIGFKPLERPIYLALSTSPTSPTHPSSSLRFFQRKYSSTSPYPNNKTSDDEDKASNNAPSLPNNRTYKLLYHRNPNRLKNPRFMLSFSTLNLTYWTWYVADFAPAINSSAQSKFDLGQIDLETLDLLTIDPTMGYVGLGVSVLIWGASVSYVRNLVSGIWKVVGEEDDTVGRSRDSIRTTKGVSLAVSTLKLPFASLPEILNRVKYDPNENQYDKIENVLFTESELKADSNIRFYAPGELAVMNDSDVNGILVKLDGEMSRKRGHLALHKMEAGTVKTGDEPLLAHLTKQGYLLDIDEFEVVPGADPDLLRAFVLREDLVKRASKKGRKREMSNDFDDYREGVSEEDSLHKTEETFTAKERNIGESIARKKRVAMGKKGSGKKKR